MRSCEELNAACLAFVNAYHGFKKDRTSPNSQAVQLAITGIRVIVGEQIIPLVSTATSVASTPTVPKLVEAPTDWALEPIDVATDEAHG